MPHDHPSADVVEYTDPICSWAWGTEPKLRLLQWRYGRHLRWRVVLGGLVHDASGGRDDWDPIRAAEPMQKYWRRSSAYTGQPYPMPMHRMARSTDPAGLAVKAAERQGPAVSTAVLRRFRESTFVFGVTPSAPEEFAASAKGVVGLDVDRWLDDLSGVEAASTYRSDWEETRRPNDHVRHLVGDDVGIGSMKQTDGHDRYAFPTLVFRGPGGEVTVPGWMPYQAYVDALESTSPGLTADPVPGPTVPQAFDRWGVLTEKELAEICGPEAVGNLPMDTVAHFWGAGVVFFSEQEAVARDLPRVSPEEARCLADLAQSMELAYSLVARIPADAWGRSTPCSEWNLRGLINHMVGSARMVSYGVRGDHIGPEFYRNHLGADPVASYRDAIDEVISLYRADPTVLGRPLPLSWGTMSGAALAEMFAADHLVHAWDVARSLGLPTDFDHGLVARLRSFGDGYADQHRVPGMFDPPVPASADATPMDRFAAFIGRR